MEKKKEIKIKTFISPFMIFFCSGHLLCTYLYNCYSLGFIFIHLNRLYTIHKSKRKCIYTYMLGWSFGFKRKNLILLYTNQDPLHFFHYYKKLISVKFRDDDSPFNVPQEG